MQLKIGTLNLCLGLPNKKTLVKNIITEEKLDILCLQETEIVPNIDHDLMSFPGFVYESERNKIRSRVGCYVKSSVSYVRRNDLEGQDSHLLILDIKTKSTTRIINIYRTFNPLGEESPLNFFKYQIDLIQAAYNKDTLLMGDLNLDWKRKGDFSYPFKNYFSYMDEKMSNFNFIQVVNFPTWSRIVNNVVKESTIDHVYTHEPSVVIDLYSVKPFFGDHVLLAFGISSVKPKLVTNVRRSWKNYSKANLLNMLEEVDWTVESDSVQSTWDIFENNLINVVDVLVPETEFRANITRKSEMPEIIKSKINKRKRMLQRYKNFKLQSTKIVIKSLDKEIRAHFHTCKIKNVRRSITPGNTESLWKAVKLARDVNVCGLPNKMFSGGELVMEPELSEKFGKFFDTKIKEVLSTVSIDEEVYNGRQLLIAENKMFMDEASIKECIMSLKPKNSEGFDRIPQRILLDGMDCLLPPLVKLFELIYEFKKIPDQWLIAKTIPIFKNKGEKNKIENYRPIANLCSTSKIFEKLILKRILEIQETNNVDITRQGQHGFKKKRSTSTLSVELQSIIARALDNDDYVLVASLDLSSAFDIVNVALLLKRLKKVGLPNDVIDLIKVWLMNRSYYVSIDGVNSVLFDLLLGTVQGSVLGPVLYAIFVSPLFDIKQVLSFADDSFNVESNKDKSTLIKDMEKSLEAITKWLKKSGMKVNQEKTELCLFYKNDTAGISLRLHNVLVKSKKEINVLGVMFDSKLQWHCHVSKVIHKANRALNAIKLLNRYFNTSELLQLLTSNFYSILYYNAEVWHIGSLKETIKQTLLAASARAIRVAFHYPDTNISYIELHNMAKRATPEMFRRYKLALLLHRTFNEQIPVQDWLSLNFYQSNMSRQTNFNIRKCNRLMVGLNVSNNRFNELNNMIPLDWFNMPINLYKTSCKILFLKY